MDRRAEPDCLKEWGASPGEGRDFAPTQVRRRPAPTKRRWRSNSVPLGSVQRRRRDPGLAIFPFASIRVRLITQFTTELGAGRCLTMIRRKFVSPISDFTQEAVPTKGSHEFFIIKIVRSEQAELVSVLTFDTRSRQPSRTRTHRRGIDSLVRTCSRFGFPSMSSVVLA